MLIMIRVDFFDKFPSELSSHIDAGQSLVHIHPASEPLLAHFHDFTR